MLLMMPPASILETTRTSRAWTLNHFCTISHLESKCFAVPPPCLRLLDALLESIFDSSWKLVPFVFGFFWRPEGCSNRAKIASEPGWGGYVQPNMASGRFLTRLGSSYHPFLAGVGRSKEAPRRPKSSKNQFWLLLRMRNVKMLIFYTPPLQNHYFWVPREAKMEPH